MTDVAPSKPARRRRMLAAGLAVVGLVLLVRAFVLAPMTVQGQSMQPTARDGDVVLVLKQLWGTPVVQRGEFVVFHDPDGALSVKRVIGLAGEQVAIRDAVLEIDGRALPEEYVDHVPIDGLYFGPVTVPAGTVFLLGDNRADSVDSGDYGPIGLDRVVGRVVWGLWPLGPVG